MVNTGSMRTSLKPSSSTASNMAGQVVALIGRRRVVAFRVMKENFPIFFESLFGSRGGHRSGRSAGFRGQDFNAELQLSLRDAAQTHKQVLTVNGKKSVSPFLPESKTDRPLNWEAKVLPVLMEGLPEIYTSLLSFLMTLYSSVWETICM